jgi:enoyl-CoA hydratase/carnithine racemase
MKITSLVVLASTFAGANLPTLAMAQSRSSVVYERAVGVGPSEARGTSTGDARSNASTNTIQHGVIGAVSGAIVGAGLGYAYVAMHCDNGVSCNATRATLTGAAIGAAVGWVVEYAIRSWPPRP